MIWKRIALVSLTILLCLADTAAARIAIRRRGVYDNFFFHGNYSTEPFAPSDTFSLEIWNCPNGELPAYVPDAEPLIACGYDAETGFTLGLSSIRWRSRQAPASIMADRAIFAIGTFPRPG